MTKEDLKMSWKRGSIITTTSEWFEATTGYPVVGAIKTYKTPYGTTPLLFMQDRVCTLMAYDYTMPMPEARMRQLIKDTIKRHDLDFPDSGKFDDQYVEVYRDGVWQDGVIDYLKLSKHKSDIEARIEDIEQLYATESYCLGRD